ncbi:uncharacterized protein [Ambystoma mexicanum]|uniref:uncharacterized protein n=1 Tax=Ambystoma mexicanum TaxID=8296 RepID=UPI0037E82432
MHRIKMDHSRREAKSQPHPDDVNDVDTPRTQNLKFLRSKRLAFFSGEKTTTSLAEKDDEQSSPAVEPAAVKPVEGDNEQEESPRYGDPQQSDNEQDDDIQETPRPHLPIKKQETIIDNLETNRSLLRRSFVSDLDDSLLEDSCIPETQKLKHVMGWAQKFLKKCHVEDHKQTSSIIPHKAQFSQRKEGKRASQECEGEANRLHSSLPHWPQDYSSSTASNACRSSCVGVKRSIEDRGQPTYYHKDGTMFSGKESLYNVKKEDWKEHPVINHSRIRKDKENRVMQLGGLNQFDGNIHRVHCSNAMGDAHFKSSCAVSQDRNVYEAVRSLTKDTLGTRDGNYFWVPLEDSSDDECVPGIRKMEPGFRYDTESKGIYGSSYGALPQPGKRVSYVRTSIPESNTSSISEISSKSEGWNREAKWTMGIIDKYMDPDYTSAYKNSEGASTKDKLKKQQESRHCFVEHHINKNGMKSLVHGFAMTGSCVGQRAKSTPECGDITGRTFIVNDRREVRSEDSELDFDKYIETGNFSNSELEHIGRSICKEEPLMSDNSSLLSIALEPTGKASIKVCPICSSENPSRNNWCMGCGCNLVGCSMEPDKISRTCLATGFLKDLASELLSSRSSTESTESPKSSSEETFGLMKAVPTQQRLCWDDESEVPSDHDGCGSVLDKYYYYMNKLKINMGEGPRTSKESDTLSEDNYSQNQLLKTTFKGNRTEQEGTLDTDISDCGGSEVPCFGNVNIEPCDVSHPRAASFSLEDILGDFDKDNNEAKNHPRDRTSIDRTHPKTKHFKPTVTAPGRYWEKSSIAWSSYTHGELKPRSQVLQRPLSAATEKRPAKEFPQSCLPAGASTTKSKITKANPGQRPSSGDTRATELRKPSDNHHKGVAQRRSVQTWTVPQDPCQRTFQDASDARNGGSESDLHLPSMWLLLPNELWIAVFTWLSHGDLSQTAQVCRRFRQLTMDDALWKIVHIQNCHSLNDDWLVSIGLRHPKSFSLYHCHDESQRITDQGLDQFFQNCKETLKELNITSCSGPSLKGDTVLLNASKYCNRLTRVDISWTGATDDGVIALAEASTSLQCLSANGCKITDEAITVLLKKHSKSLTKLEVFGCHALTPKCLSSVAADCIHLQTLNIGRVPKVTDGCLTKIAAALKQLTTLNLTGLNVVRDRVVHHIVKQCPRLEALTISSCSQVTDVSLVEISTYLPTIRYLDVSGCKKVTDTGIQALARSCHQLGYLDLSSTGTGKRGVCLLASYCHSTLECLKLSFCTEVTADAVEKLCKNCRRLKTLHLYGCRITPDLHSIKQINKSVKLYHDLSIPAWNTMAE